jgi:hypothetical protein
LVLRRRRAGYDVLLVVLVLIAGGIAACGGTRASATPTHPAPAPQLTTVQPGRPPGKSTFAGSVTFMYATVLDRLVAANAFVNGVWHPASSCWRCGTELGTVAAVVSAHSQDPKYRGLALSTFDAALSAHQNRNGSFGPPDTGDQISTGAELVSMGTAYLILYPSMSAAERARWAAAIRRAARWLSPRLDFYVNGNINLQATLGMYLGWRATGDTALRTAYQRSLHFTLQPGRHWRGDGLHYAQAPHRRDGSDGAGYLAEKGTGAPGFDAHYTILQDDYAAELYALSRDPKALRLLNLLTNQLLTRTNKRTMIIQTGSGSRDTAPNISGKFVSSSIPVLAFLGGRRGLRPAASTQLAVAQIDFLNYVAAGMDQDQVIGNYVSALLPFTAVSRP